MAKFRKVHTAFWDDTYIERLSPEDKYFYLFLLTNPLCTECGIYSISIRKIAYYTGYNEETVILMIEKFTKAEKIRFDQKKSEIAIIKKLKYLDRLGKPIIDCLKSELSRVKNIDFIKIIMENTDNQQIKTVFYEYITIRERNDKLKITISGQEEEEEEEEEEDLRRRSETFPLIEIYNKSWDELSKILSGQLGDLTEELFKKWKNYADLVRNNEKMWKLYECKFLPPKDFAFLYTKKGFSEDSWTPTLEKILSTGIKPDHDLYFRIPQFMDTLKSKKDKKGQTFTDVPNSDVYDSMH